MPKIEKQLSFKVSEEFYQKFSQDCVAAESNPSEFLRACVVLASATLVRHPWMIHNVNRNKCRGSEQ